MQFLLSLFSISFLFHACCLLLGSFLTIQFSESFRKVNHVLTHISFVFTLPVYYSSFVNTEEHFCCLVHSDTRRFFCSASVGPAVYNSKNKITAKYITQFPSYLCLWWTAQYTVLCKIPPSSFCQIIPSPLSFPSLLNAKPAWLLCK